MLKRLSTTGIGLQLLKKSLAIRNPPRRFDRRDVGPRDEDTVCLQPVQFGQKSATVKMFSEAYAQNSRLPQGLCPFTPPGYRDMIDSDKLVEMVLDE